MLGLENECPEMFPTCVVTRSQSYQGANSCESVDQPVELADTFFSSLSGLSNAHQYNRKALIAEQREHPDLSVGRNSAASFEESRDMAYGLRCADA